MQPLVSVIIPVYNLESYVDATLRSVERQTFTDFEILVVNDGSMDNTAEVLRHHAAQDSRIVVITTPNQGVARAREEGIKRARGKYICFLDGDDRWEADMLMQLTAVIEKNGGYDIVCCNYKRVCSTYTAPVRERQKEDMCGYEFLEATLSHAISVTVWSKLYRATLFDSEIRHYPLRLGQDGVLNIQIGIRQPRVTFIDYPGYCYIQRPGSSNHSHFDIAYCNLFCNTVEAELARHPEFSKEQVEFYGLLNKIRWYEVYIRRSRSPWAAESDFAQRVYELIDKYKDSLHNYYSAGTLLLLKIYRLHWMIPAVVVLFTTMRWGKSMQRRLAR